MGKIFNMVNKMVAKRFGTDSSRSVDSSARVIVENGSVRANYDNREVRQDLLKEMSKFANFHTTGRK